MTTADILGPSEAFLAPMDYYAHAPNSRELLSRLAAFKPTTLACMHGSASQGNGAGLLLALADRVARSKEAPGSAEADEFLGSLTDPNGRQGYDAHVGERRLKSRCSRGASAHRRGRCLNESIRDSWAARDSILVWEKPNEHGN